MKISLVVPAYNEEKILARSLAAMRAACAAWSARGWKWELVVCNNNSTDRTAEIAEQAGARVVFEPVNQISRARNAGGFAACGEWLVFVDADSFPSQRLFELAAGHIASGRCIGGGCVVRLDQPARALGLVVFLWNTVSRLRHWAAGSFIFCQAAAFRELDGFSRELFASEELDFSKRLKKLGKSQGRRMVIISQEPLVTSARKMKLYTLREHIAFLWKLALSPRNVPKSREQCHIWYDGRR